MTTGGNNNCNCSPRQQSLDSKCLTCTSSQHPLETSKKKLSLKLVTAIYYGAKLWIQVWNMMETGKKKVIYIPSLTSKCNWTTGDGCSALGCPPVNWSYSGGLGEEKRDSCLGICTRTRERRAGGEGVVLGSIFVRAARQGRSSKVAHPPGLLQISVKVSWSTLWASNWPTYPGPEHFVPVLKIPSHSGSAQKQSSRA